MSDTESVSSMEGDGDIVMSGVPRTYSYKITFNLYYDNTYEQEEVEDWESREATDDDASTVDSEDGYRDGEAVSCDDDACSCSGFEEPLNGEQVDEFMRETYCEKPRYYWYCVSVLSAIGTTTMECNVRDVTYEDGGRLQAILDITRNDNKGRISPARLEYKINELDLYNSIYAGSPGNEAIIPTKHKYRYIVMSTLRFEATEKELGRIAFRGGLQIEVA